jgi:anti-sigma factor RsiW
LVIKTDIEAAALLQQYRQHVQELHRIYDGVLNEPVPERMLDLLRRRKTEGA